MAFEIDRVKDEDGLHTLGVLASGFIGFLVRHLASPRAGVATLLLLGFIWFLAMDKILAYLEKKGLVVFINSEGENEDRGNGKNSRK